MKIYTPPSKEAEQIAVSLDKYIAELEVVEHPFLQRFATDGMSREQLRDFSPQWYTVITSHKRAFAGLIYNTPDERLRGDLISLLYDEFGAGNPERMHTTLWLRVPEVVGLTKEQITQTKAIPEVLAFNDVVMKRWGSSVNPAEAYGMVYLFEKVGADFHKKFLDGLQRSSLPEHALEYSRLHAVAEEEHSKIIVNGLKIYEDQIDLMRTGVDDGAMVLRQLWDGLHTLCYREQE